MTKTYKEQVADELHEMKKLGMKVPLMAFTIANEVGDDTTIMAMEEMNTSVTEAASLCVELSL